MNNNKETTIQNYMKERKVVRRGYNENDKIFFTGEKLNILFKASEEVLYLLNHDYKIKQATTFVGNHHLLQERQRVALARSLASDVKIVSRRRKMVESNRLEGAEVYIDGFNAIIPMETMLSGSILLKGMDGVIRDLADLKGSYKIIDKTEKAIHMVLSKLDELKVTKANIYLDKPISNSGRLKTFIQEISGSYNVTVEVDLLNAVDRALYGKENIISGDSVVIDESISWISLYDMILEDYIINNDAWVIDFQQTHVKKDK